MDEVVQALDELHQKLCSAATSDSERNEVAIQLKRLLRFEEQCCPLCEGPASEGLACYPYRRTLMCLACYANSWIQEHL